ncbi:MAG: glycosyltransferase family 2 protein [Bacteriovoracia bacterium]
MYRIAVLMTCFNRKLKTLECLKALFDSKIPEEYSLEVYLVDDGSTDGTSEAIESNYPQVFLIKGNGALFWNKGMHLAFKTAAVKDYDFYVWLNDDTQLYKDALQKALETWKNRSKAVKHEKNIIVGTTCDPEKQTIATYGGVKRKKGLHPLRYEFLGESDEIQSADTFNGNIVLIPKSVHLEIGNLDPRFSHGIGDFDYGLRAKKKECNIFVAPGFLGKCSRNPIPSKMSYFQRINKMFSKKGLPFKDWVVYSFKHAGPFWFVWVTIPYIKIFFGKNHN